MRKKIKLGVLMTALLTLTSCSQSCDRLFWALMDYLRFVYIATALGIYGLNGPTAFLVVALGSIPCDDILAPEVSIDFTLSRSSPWGIPTGPLSFGNKPQAQPPAVTSGKPPMYIVSSSNNAVFAVDSKTDALITKIMVGNGPTRGAIDSVASEMYVTNSLSDSISAINLKTNQVSGTIPLLPGSHPTGIVITRDGKQMYVINSALNSVSAVDPEARTILTTFAVGSGPGAIALTPDDSLLYVANSRDNTVWVVDTLTNERVTTITGITNPTATAFNRQGSTAYITSGVSPVGSLVLLRTKDYTVRTRINVGSNPVNVTRDRYDTLIYVVNKGSSNVTIINSSDNSVAGTISLGGAPNAVVSIP